MSCMPTTLEPGVDADLRLLLGPEAAELLREFFLRSDGVVVAHRIQRVSHRPNRSTTVTYRADVEWSSGRLTDETVIAMTGEAPPAGATELSNGVTSVAMWRWPHDPLLPGLSSALDRNVVAKLFAELGVAGGVRDLRVRAYRPGRRAVVEATGERGRMFLKVVRPAAVRRLHDLHRSMAGHLPVPDSVGWSDDGVLVIPAVPGATLRERLRSQHGDLPPPAAIGDLLDALPLELMAGKPRLDWLDHARHHARVIRETVPSAADHVSSLVERLESRHDANRDIEHEVVPVHGDLYEAQLIVEGSTITGLLDVDTAGAGHRIDDLANFCAHLSVLATVTRPSNRIRSFGADLLAYAESRFERRDVRARVAAATLGLATGPFSVLEANWHENTVRRLELADRWVAGSTR